MIKLFQRVGVFYISKFEAAVKAMEQSALQPWAKKISNQQKNQLWALYKQATQGDQTQKMNQQKGNYPNMGSPMTAFRSIIGKQTAQGATECDILKQQLKNEKSMGQNKTSFNQNTQKSTGDGTKGLNRQQTLSSRKAQDISTPGYGDQTGKQAQRLQKKGSQPRSRLDRQGSYEFEGKSKKQAEDQYVRMARSILERNKADKYLKDL